MSKKHTKLNQFLSTAICGNDIMSSVLYVSGIAIGVCGVWSPLILLFIGFVLFIYQGVYREVVESLPINGGAYNALLNGTSKKVAATAGMLTILSYIATCVISGKSAVEYLNTLLNFQSINLGFVSISPVILMTTIVLTIFAFIVIGGVKDSAKIALGIFLFHLAILIIFVLLGIFYITQHPSQFGYNIDYTNINLLDHKDLLLLLFLGFSSSLLGVSGFESSANFVEEQQKGVFKKTLRNMLIGVAIFNPLVAFIALNINKIGQINEYKDFLLSNEALIIGGKVFQVVLVADAFLVLCGAVLTSFIGVSGLINRMALDEVLPGWFTKKNLKGSFPRIVLTFLVLCVSILIITNGDLLSLGGVYAIAFLSVMSMFAIGNIILKVTRPDLKRYYKFPLTLVLIAAIFTISGVVGNILLDIKNLVFFAIYFIPLFIIVRGYMNRHYLTLSLKFIFRNYKNINTIIEKIFDNTIKGKCLVFIHRPERLFDILKYINYNEVGRNIIIIHCKDENDPNNTKTWEELNKILPLLASAGIFPHLKIKAHQVVGEFNPSLINKISKRFSVNKNKIFIGSIHHHHPFDYDELGGVRIIM